jgi:hypothetical protein
VLESAILEIVLLPGTLHPPRLSALVHLDLQSALLDLCIFVQLLQFVQSAQLLTPHGFS